MELDRRFAQWPIGTPRIKWSAVFAGWAVGLALQIVLTLAGLGFGAWAIDLHDANPGEDVPVGAAIWTGLSMLLSAFIAGYMTAGCSGSADRRDGLYHGVVVWGVNWLVCAWLTTTAMATMIGGAFSVFGTTLQTLEQALAQAASATVSRTAGRVTLSIDDLRTEIESVLRITGQLELPPKEQHRTGERSLGRVRQGEPLSRMTDQDLANLRDMLSALDRESAVHFMVNTLALSEAQARDVVQSTIGLIAPLPDTMRGTKQRSTAVGAEALDRLGMITLWLSGLALISLVMSALGGMIGTPDVVWAETTTSVQSYRDVRRAI